MWYRISIPKTDPKIQIVGSQLLLLRNTYFGQHINLVYTEIIRSKYARKEVGK